MFPAARGNHDPAPGAPPGRRSRNPAQAEPGILFGYSQYTANVRLAPAILDVIPTRIAPPHRVSLPIHDKIPVHE